MELFLFHTKIVQTKYSACYAKNQSIYNFNLPSKNIFYMFLLEPSLHYQLVTAVNSSTINRFDISLVLI